MERQKEKVKAFLSLLNFVVIHCISFILSDQTLELQLYRKESVKMSVLERMK